MLTIDELTIDFADILGGYAISLVFLDKIEIDIRKELI